MQKHSSLERGNHFSATKLLWPDCSIEADPYRLPAHIGFEVPQPAFSRVPVNRSVSIYNGFVVIIDRLGQHSASLRIIPLEDFAAIIVRVGFSTHGYRQIGSAVYLHHVQLGLDLPLYTSPNCCDTAAFWQSWSRVLGLPAMSVGAEGELIDPFNRVGKLHVCKTLDRRATGGGTEFRPAFRRQSAFQQRRMVEVSRSVSMPVTNSAARKNGSNVYRLFGQ